MRVVPWVVEEERRWHARARDRRPIRAQIMSSTENPIALDGSDGCTDDVELGDAKTTNDIQAVLAKIGTAPTNWHQVRVSPACCAQRSIQ